MVFWIRSQDKEELQKISSRLFIRRAKNATYAIVNDLCVDDRYIDLGVYKTKERALEVLDEIQKILMNNTLESSIAKCYKLDNYVYEMPEE